MGYAPPHVVPAGTKSQEAESPPSCLLWNRKMPYTLISFLILFWLVGLVAHIGGTLVYLFLAAAIVVFVFDLIDSRRTSA
jgi:hypothetical protein